MVTKNGGPSTCQTVSSPRFGRRRSRRRFETPATSYNIAMRFWLREIMGWLLVLLGTAIWLLIVLMLISDPPMWLNAASLVLPAIFLFRGGIHLLKVAAAVRVCQDAERRENPPAAVVAPRPATG